jgi:hypothetical protein
MGVRGSTMGVRGSTTGVRCEYALLKSCFFPPQPLFTSEVSLFPPRPLFTLLYFLRTVKVSNNNIRSISYLDGFGSRLLCLQLKVFLCMHNRWSLLFYML